MKRRNWKRLQPQSQHEAIRFCLDYARERHNRSVANIADLIGSSEWVIYKYLSEGSMPSARIRPFEFACGCTYLTQYIAHSAHKLLVDIPRGKPVKDTDVLSLQTGFNDAVNLLINFYNGHAPAEETIGALSTAMAQIAGHRENVAKHLTPELDLFEENTE